MFKKLIFIFLFGTVISAMATDWNAEIEQADQLYKQGNFSKALELYRETAEMTASTYAQLQTAWIYQNGLGVKKDCSEAARWYTFAANANNAAAQNNLYTIYWNGCDPILPDKEQAIDYLKKAANSGLARAQSNISLLYIEGKYIKSNPYLAYDYAHKSAQQGDIEGILILSRCYSEGIGVPRDDRKAADLLEHAATMQVDDYDKNSKQYAQYLLGKMYLGGTGVAKNLLNAYKWLLLASAGNDRSISSQSNELIKSISGSIANKDKLKTQDVISSYGPEKVVSDKDLAYALSKALNDNKKDNAIYLANTLSDKKNYFGQYVLGLMRYEGYGSVKKDLDESYVLFKRSCQSGFFSACLYKAQILCETSRKDDAKKVLYNLD
ncbi:MAG: tetratricopeptide repeat protein, partial [Halothiobacillus sp.]|nr:tetratricopeptide repeat protein [Halothiobacillus sp.]